MISNVRGAVISITGQLICMDAGPSLSPTAVRPQTAETWTQWPQREARVVSPAFQGHKHVISWIWKKELPEGSKCVCPAWYWITQSPKRLKRDGERGNEGGDKVHQKYDAFYGYKTCCLKKGHCHLPPQAVELPDNHVEFLSQHNAVQNIHFIKAMNAFLSVIDWLYSKAVEEFTLKSCFTNIHTLAHKSEMELVWNTTATCMSTLNPTRHLFMHIVTWTSTEFR